MVSFGRKCLALFVCGLLLLSPLSAVAGTAGPVYTDISDKAGLDAIRHDPDGHYRLTADITFTAEDFAVGGMFYNGGNGWDPIGSGYDARFTGELDGNGHTIAGLTITQTANSGSIYAGLFGYADGSIHDLTMTDTTITVTGGNHVYAGCVVAVGIGNIDNITVTECRIIVQDTAIAAKVGSIAGRMISGSLRYSTATGEVNVTGVSPAIGGVVGQSHASIEQIYSQVELTTDSRGDCHVGGIAGINEDAIHASLATGRIQVTSASDGNIGGIAGWNQKNISDSLAMGKQIRAVSHYDNFGGVAGSSDGTIRNAYYTAVSCPNSPTIVGVSVLTDTQLTTPTNFVGWNFETDWCLGYIEGIAHPLPQVAARVVLKQELAALMVPVNDPVRYTTLSLESLRTAQQQVTQLTDESPLADFVAAKKALQQAYNGLSEKELICRVVGNGSVNISGTNRYGQSVTLTASPAAGQVFSGFLLHRVFYPASSTDVVVSGAENAVAYFRSENACTVLFRGKYGRVVNVQTVTSVEELTAPDAPLLQGYTFVGWDADLEQLDLSSGCVSVDAVYAVDDQATGYTLTLIDAVADRAVDAPLPFDTRVTLTPAKKDGQNFSHWLVNGVVASTDTTYSLFVAGNDTVQAMYQPEAWNPTVSLQHTYYTATDGKYTLNAIGQVFLPETATVVEYGMLLAADSRIVEDPDIFTLNSLDCSTLSVTSSSWQPNRRYLTYFTGVRPGATRYLRSYLVFLTEDGDHRIMYSPVTAVTLPAE